jgi:hypothetical protein
MSTFLPFVPVNTTKQVVLKVMLAILWNREEQSWGEMNMLASSFTAMHVILGSHYTVLEPQTTL